MNRLALLFLCTLAFSLIEVDGKQNSCKKPKGLKGAVPFTVYLPNENIIDPSSESVFYLTNHSAYCASCTNGYWKGWFSYAEAPIDPENTYNFTSDTTGGFSSTVCAIMSQLCMKGKVGKKTVYYTLQNDNDRLRACGYTCE